MSDDWISVREAARWASCDPSTVRRWVDAGKVSGRVSPGGTRQVSLRSLEEAHERATVARQEKARSRRVRGLEPANPAGVPSLDPFDAVVHLAKVADGWRQWKPRRSMKVSDLELLSTSAQTLIAALEDVGWVAEETVRDRLDESR